MKIGFYFKVKFMVPWFSIPYDENNACCDWFLGTQWDKFREANYWMWSHEWLQGDLEHCVSPLAKGKAIFKGENWSAPKTGQTPGKVDSVWREERNGALRWMSVAVQWGSTPSQIFHASHFPYNMHQATKALWEATSNSTVMLGHPEGPQPHKRPTSLPRRSTSHRL